MRTLPLLAGLALALTACSASPAPAPAVPVETPMPSAAPSAIETPPPTPTPVAAEEQDLPAGEARFVKAVRGDRELMDAMGDMTDGQLVGSGRDFCNLPPTVAEIVEHRQEYTVIESSAVKFLCPEYRKVWTRGVAAFDEGDLVVGEDVKPGRYRTLNRKVKDCYWERTTRGGSRIANDFVTFAPAGVTVTILASDGGFSSERCGVWVPV